MPQALLIYGNAQRFMHDVSDLRSFISRRVGIRPRRIRAISTTFLVEDVLEYRLSSAAAERTKEPLLILFSGHGCKKGWALDDVRIFDYSRLAGALARGKRPIVLVNDCCHSMAAVDELDRHAGLRDRLSLIASAESGAVSYGRLVHDVTRSWRLHRAVACDPGLRWGATRDYLFFPKEPAG